MRPCPFTEEQENFIKENYKNYKAKEISEMFDVKKYQVYNYIMKEGLMKKPKRERKRKMMEGFFDVNARWNWAI